MENNGIAAMMASPKRHHAIKCWPEYFNQTLYGTKTFEVRKNDRDYRSGDSVSLHEFCPFSQKYTGRVLKGTVGYVYYQADGLAHGFCVFAIHVPEVEKMMYREGV